MRRQVEVSLIDVGLAILLFLLPHDLDSDGLARFQALSGLLDHGDVSNMGYSLVGPLFSTPLYLVGKLYLTSGWWCARFNTVVLTCGLIAMNRLLRNDVDRSVLRKFWLLLIAASMFSYHVREYFGEVFTAVCVAVGILAVRFERPLAGWAAVVVGVVNTPASLVGLGLVALRQVWDTRRWRNVLPVIVAALLIVLESWLRRGGPFVSGYAGNSGARTLMPYSGQPGFSYPLFFGVLAILLSFGKGLLFFAPGLLLPITSRASIVGERLRASYHLWIWFLVGLILAYAKWWSWYGGWFWGPRFFLFASVPASLAAAVWLHKAQRLSQTARVGLVLVLTLSTWVGVNGALFGQNDLDVCLQNSYAMEHLCWYVPEFSVLWHPFVIGSRPSIDQTIIAVYFVVVYVWLVLPVITEIVRTGARTVAAGVNERRHLTAWRF